MKFNEAMEKLKSGSKVTRRPWKDDIYFLMVKKEIKAFRRILNNYIFDNDIMLSEGWLIDTFKDEYKFCHIIPFIMSGSKAKLKGWKDQYIYFDLSSSGLVLSSMETLPFTPDFLSFAAEDWEEIE